MKTALVLSGGGAKGSIQFGIFKYLYEQGLRPDVIYGTSVGALNASGYSFQGIESLSKIWASLKSQKDVFRFNWSSLLLRTTGLYNANPLKKLLQTYVIGEPACDTYTCIVSLKTGEVKYVHCKETNYINAVLASASVPVFNDVVDGEWVDGGLRDQTPLKKAILDGATKIIVILCNPLVINPEESPVGNWIQNILKTTGILSHEIFLNDIQTCLWYNRNLIDGKRPIELEIYAPSKAILDTHEFSREKIIEAIQYGYEEAKKGPIDLNYIEQL